MKVIFIATAVMLASCALATASDGLTTVKSSQSFDVTKTRLVEAIKARNFNVMAEVDHAAAATSVGAQLRPTHLVIFGNPRGGTPLMACDQRVGIDLPLKALVWQAEDGTVNVSVNTPTWVGERHKVAACAGQPLTNMTGALTAIATDATKP
jgi:uncharacterized protein (DUF302 family)